MGTYQSVNPAIVFNGDIQPYTVASHLNTDGSFTQLMGFDSDYLDAFSRLRVSTPQPLLEVMFTHDLVPLMVEANVATNATIAHSANLASAILTTSTDDNSKAILQTRQIARIERNDAQSSHSHGGGGGGGRSSGGQRAADPVYGDEEPF